MTHYTKTTYVLMTLILFSFFNFLNGQDFERFFPPVTESSKTLAYPWAGGLRSPQFSNIDFNNDGVQDLFIFDRNGGVIIPMVKVGTTGTTDYRYAPEYAKMFPKLQAWVLIRDFNDDGVPDIFGAAQVGGSISVYRGKRNADGNLSFSLMVFSNGIREILSYWTRDGYVNLYTSPVDMPDIRDIDGDGDLDILSFEPDGSYATYYRNMAMEKNLGKDTLDYERSEVCWGRFGENSQSDLVTLSNGGADCPRGIWMPGDGSTRHAGSTLCLLDLDGDKDMDLLIGDLSSSRIVKLVNGGNQNTALITEVEYGFPANDVPVKMPIFLAAYHVDVDGDGNRDLIVAPNESGSGQSFDHIWYYKNNGKDDFPVFNLVTKDFLIANMVHLNSASHPAFADVNGDGLVDIVVGTDGYFPDGLNKFNRMALLLNTGTKKAPSFNVADKDVFKFSTFGEFTGRFAPTFADIDDDGDLDLFVGDTRGFIYYGQNTGGKDKQMVFEDIIYRYNDINVGSNSSPVLYDVDNDGILDLVVGEKNNELDFFKNQGTINNPIFSKDVQKLPNTIDMGNIFPNGRDAARQSGNPYFLEINDKLVMLFGSEDGDIFMYGDITGNIYDDFTLLDSKVGGVFDGRRIKISLADLDDDGKLEMVVGNERGGLCFYKTRFIDPKTVSVYDQTTQFEYEVFPNPAQEQLFIYATQSEISAKLYSIDGIFIQSLAVNKSNDISSLVNGIYLLIAESNGQKSIKKIVKL